MGNVLAFSARFASNGGSDGRVGMLRTFDGGIVFIHEMALDELDCETALPDATAADDNEFVFPKELRHGSVWLTGNGATKADRRPRDVLLKPLREVRRSQR